MESILIKKDGIYPVMSYESNSNIMDESTYETDQLSDEKYSLTKDDNFLLKVSVDEDCDSQKNCGKVMRESLILDPRTLYVLLQTLNWSKRYRNSFINKWYRSKKTKKCCDFSLENTESNNGYVMNITTDSLIPPYIDKKWSRMLTLSVLERIHLEETMSWLSTLGGACSALGDYNLNWADKAEVITLQQMNIALSVGDPAIMSRCKLYMAIAAIQKGKYKFASWIIREEFKKQRLLPKESRDTRLIKMCLGIWEKLQFTKSSLKNSQL